MKNKEEQICGGNREQCQNHGEMPEEIKQFFDKLFGGVK